MVVAEVIWLTLGGCAKEVWLLRDRGAVSVWIGRTEIDDRFAVVKLSQLYITAKSSLPIPQIDGFVQSVRFHFSVPSGKKG